MTQQQPKPEEVLGMIQGLASAMQTSFDAQKATTKQVTEIANSLKDLAEAQSKPSVPQGLRLPPVHLPTFKGDPQDNLSRFLEHFKSIISTSAISPRFYVAYLKQQCESDVRAFDIRCKAEQDHFKAYIPDQEKASDAEYLTYFERITDELSKKRGMPKDQKIRELLMEYYSMKQGSAERVCDFAHRFHDVQNELIKLIPNIHLTPDGSDVELRHAFTIKLRTEIQREIVSRDFTYSSLQEIVQVAERFEKIHPPTMSEWKHNTTSAMSIDVNKTRQTTSFPPCVFCKKTNHSEKNCFHNPLRVTRPSSYQQHVPSKPVSQPLPKPGNFKTICINFNSMANANCEQPNNQCSYGRQHKCLVCQKWGCKRINHTKSPNTVQKPALARVNLHTPETSPDIQAKIDQLTSTVSNLSSCVSKLANNAQAVTQVTTSSPNEPPRAPTTLNTNVIGMPTVSNLEHCKVSQGLQQRNILWTRVNSGGIDLPLPVDSCCSVSLVSGAHTDHLLKTNSQLKYTPLPDPIPVAVANPTAQLKAIGTMEVPFTFANGHTTTFLMLSVPGLAWPILYGENHLQITNALIDHQALTITFRHPSLNVTIKCQTGNPLHAFPHLAPANLSTGTTTDKNPSSTASSAQVTCLLTGLPSPNQPRTRIQINRGLNIITILPFSDQFAH